MSRDTTVIVGLILKRRQMDVYKELGITSTRLQRKKATSKKSEATYLQAKSPL